MALAMKAVFAVTFSLGLLTTLQADSPFSKVDEAFRAYDLATAKQRLRVITQSSTNRGEAAEAYMRLAKLARRFDRDELAADKALDSVLRLAADKAPSYIERANLKLDFHRFDAAVFEAGRAIKIAKNPDMTAEARHLRAKAVLAGADPTRVSLATSDCLAALKVQPGNPSIGETLTGLAVIGRDWPNLRVGWETYFMIADRSAVPLILSTAYSSICRIASKPSGSRLTKRDRVSLASALATSRFFRLSLTIDKSSKDINAYVAFLNDLDVLNSNTYPRVACGLRKYEESYHAAFTRCAKTLWTKIVKKGELYGEDEFFALINRKFGADGYMGTTVNFYGLVLGHVIQDETRSVSQYGLTANFRYVSLDRMASRDFTTWYGTTNVGGWGTESTMFQIRPAYLTEPFQRLRWMTVATARESLKKEILEFRRADMIAAQSNPLHEARSLAPQIKLSQSEALYTELKAKYRDPLSVASAFVRESMRLNVEATVFAHEGRHALDQKYFPKQFLAWSDDERELRAKYSEVIFSQRPLLALTGSIFGSNLDDSSGHGLANRRLRQVLVDWISAHSSEVSGFRADIPSVLQIDHLTNDQLVTILKTADPMSRETTSSRSK